MSALGNSIAGIVRPWIVLERTGDPAAAGLVAAAVAVPSVIFASLGGYLIDTVGRKPMSVISDIILEPLVHRFRHHRWRGGYPRHGSASRVGRRCLAGLGQDRGLYRRS
ncbi:hypothetical protein [Corynebacterium stationis]|uniref:hypothetical protein n=1 Tax=Corynebacterium stationis TaxID=1705 RepID=UPI001CD64EE9|nr:hypothetical protein [Corynebacterium stationis]